jgi:hypothetical protein
MKNRFCKLPIKLGLCLGFIFMLFIQITLAQNQTKIKRLSPRIFNLSKDTIGNQKTTSGNTNQHPSIDSGIIWQQQLDNSLIMDPTTNTVPIERLLEAKKIRDQLLSRASLKASNKSGNSPTIPTINWTERGPNNIGGRTRTLLFDLNDKANGYKKVYAGAVGGGLWYTNDITATDITWNKVDDFMANLAISCITQDPVNPLIIYVGTGEDWGTDDTGSSDGLKGLGLWKTSDGGKTWTQLSSTTTFSYVNNLLVDKNENVYIAGKGIGIQKSIDGGSTWLPVLSVSNKNANQSNDGSDLELAANGDIYAAFGNYETTGQVLLSDYSKNGINTGNAGTWVDITPKPNLSDAANTSWGRIKLACAPSNPNITYALLTQIDNHFLASFQQYDKSTNTWSEKPQFQLSSGANDWTFASALAVDPNNANNVYVGSFVVVTTADGGNTWNQLSDPYTYPNSSNLNYVPFYQLAFTYQPNNSNRLLLGTVAGIYSYNPTDASSVGTPVFVERNHGYNVTQFYSVALHPTDPNYALAGPQDNNTQQFTTSGLNSTNQITINQSGNRTWATNLGGFAYIDQINPNIQISQTRINHFVISRDNGKNFYIAPFNISGFFVIPTDYDSFKGNLYGETFGGNFFRWGNVSNNNNKADIVGVANFKGDDVTAVTVSSNIPGRVYFGLYNGNVVMVDHADTVSTATGVILKSSVNNGTVSSVAIDPANENHLLITYSNYGIQKIFETKDASASPVIWSPVQGNLPDMPVRWGMFYPDFPGKAIIATELGVWTTDSLNDVNTIWQPSNSGLANVSVRMLKYRPADRTLAAATHGRGLFTTTLSALGKTQQVVSLSGKSLATYGDADFSLQASSSNYTIPIVLKSSNPNVATISATGLVHITGAGTANISATQIGNNQFQLGIPAYKTLTILPASLTIKADNKIKFVGTANPTLTVSYSGFINNDTPDSLTTLPTITTTADNQSPIGHYKITANNASSSKYIFNYITGDLSVVTPEGAPTIASISPMGGKIGDTIHIVGTNFVTTTDVSFGGVPASSFVVNSANSITAIIGNGASGDVAVTNPGATTKLSGFLYIFSLPANNFKVTIASVTCNGGNDGTVTIRAVKSLAYTAILNKTGFNQSYNFTDSLKVANLTPGTYSLSITLASQPSYQQSFTVVLTQPQALSVYTNLNTNTNTLQLLLGGATNYQIKLNGETYSTNQNTFELPLSTGINNLQVSTDLACQGIYSKIINLSGNNAPYPQPFQNLLNINVGTNNVGNITFEVYAVINGKKVYSTTLRNQSGVIQLDLSSIEPGIYSLKMNLDNFEKTFKIIKK